MISFMRCINITSRCANQYRSDRLAGSGLNGCHSAYILHICRSPGITQDQLSKRIYINKSNVTRQLAMLSDAGFIERRPNEADKREVLVYPTQKALDVLPMVQEVLHEWNDYITEDLTDAEKETLSGLLERVMAKAMAHVDGIKKEQGEDHEQNT